jgi:L-methionine (R)-S-oxide reductase
MQHILLELPSEKPDLYRLIEKQFAALVEGETDFLANAANLAALLFHALPGVSWAGWYFLKENKLLLGPFQGKPACTRIPWGKGVCGAAAQTRRTVIVPDVSRFPGHIACDPAGKAEIVVPLISGDRLLGVLDLDSEMCGRFNAEDQKGLENLAGVLLAHSSNPRPA